MYETEIKVLEIDRQKIEEKLISLGARKIFDDEIHAIYYDTPDHAIRRGKGTFRLRREGPKSVLTFKAHVDNSAAKIREETEVVVSDFDAMRTILQAIGFSSWLEMKKHRTSYECSGLHFELDRYTEEFGFIPEFLEIEGPDVRTVYEAAAVLGYAREACRSWDALQVAEYYSSQGRRTEG